MSGLLYAEKVKQVCSIGKDGHRAYQWLTLLWSDEHRTCLVRTLGRPVHRGVGEIQFGFNKYRVEWL